MAVDEPDRLVTVGEFNDVLNARFGEITGRMDERFERMYERFERMYERFDKLEKAQLQRKANKQAAFEHIWEEWADGNYGLFLYRSFAAFAGDMPDHRRISQRVKGE